MSMRQEDNSIPLSDISRALEQGVAGADPMRVVGLEGLHRMRSVKASSLEREQARLSRKLGANHPRIAELEQKIETNRVLTRNLAVEIDRAKIEIPIADENTWILHGYVRNRELQGMPNLTVAIYDQRGNWIEQVGYACTDQTGYFKLSYTDERRAEQDTTDLQTRIGIAAAQQSPALFVHVLDGQSQLLHVEQLIRTPELGQVDYMELILGGEASTCQPPLNPNQQPAPNRELRTPPPNNSPGPSAPPPAENQD